MKFCFRDVEIVSKIRSAISGWGAEDDTNLAAPLTLSQGAEGLAGLPGPPGADGPPVSAVIIIYLITSAYGTL